MNTQTRMFRIFAVVIAFIMLFSQVAGVARADDKTPPVKQKAEVTPVSLDEVKNYFGPLRDIKSPVGVVVELEDTPAALIYAQSGTNEVAAATINQINLIQQKQAAFMAELQANGIQATELFRTQKVYNGIWLRVDVNSLDKIAAIAGVIAIHPIIPKTLDHTTSVPLIGAPQVWGGSGEFQGQDIKIGIIDTGVDYIHYDFGGSGVYVGQDFTTLDEPLNEFPTAKVVGGYDFVGDDYNADPNASTYNPVPAPDPDPMDCYGHGTHVAGTAAGFGVTADGTTYLESGADTYASLKNLTADEYINKFLIGPGVAPKALLFSLRVFGCEGSTDVVEEAIEWAMDPNNDGDLSDHLDVINMSLGSKFGTQYDTSAVASNNAAQAGIIVVAAAGNANDVYYITDSPSVAGWAISAAASVDESARFNAFEVTENTAPTPQAPVGLYPATLAVFGPQSFNQEGVLAKYSDTDDGCSAYSAGFFDGKIALIKRGGCNFTVKVKNAQDAGALGALLYNNTDAFPVTMGGSDPTITIPSMLTTQAVGTALKADLDAGTVTVLLTTEHPNAVLLRDPSIVDTIASFSSRGPARAGTYLKPDITAPGDSVFSAASGERSQGASFSGTSMATPHVAGVMALLREIHPTWSVAELKALAMNTATHDLWTDTAHTGKHTPTRVGAGRVDVANASLSPVIAFNSSNPELVSLSFGEQAVLGTQTFVKSITLKNTGSAAAEFTADFSSYYQDNPGLTFTLLNEDDTPLSNPLSVAAGGTLEVKMKITADATMLTRARDASISLANGRQRISEGGGYVNFTPSGDLPALRVPVHITARPASNMTVAESKIELPEAATGTFSLTPAGTPVDTVDDTSLVSILELKAMDANESSSSGINNDADLHYVGTISDYPFYAFDESTVYFGIATYGKWDTSHAVEFDVYIDANEDGTDDYVVFNTNFGLFTGVTDDVMLTAFCDLNAGVCDAFYYTNLFSGGTNTNLYNNNVMVLPIPSTLIGLVDGSNTDFNFYVVSYSREAPAAVDRTDLMSYDLAHQSFTAVSPDTESAMWLDLPGGTLDLTYDKAAIDANDSQGLLLLHHHNKEGNTAQVLTFENQIFNIWLPLIYK